MHPESALLVGQWEQRGLQRLSADVERRHRRVHHVCWRLRLPADRMRNLPQMARGERRRRVLVLLRRHHRRFSFPCSARASWATRPVSEVPRAPPSPHVRRSSSKTTDPAPPATKWETAAMRATRRTRTDRPRPRAAAARVGAHPSPLMNQLSPQRRPPGGAGRAMTRRGARVRARNLRVSPGWWMSCS